MQGIYDDFTTIKETIQSAKKRFDQVRKIKSYVDNAKRLYNDIKEYRQNNANNAKQTPFGEQIGRELLDAANRRADAKTRSQQSQSQSLRGLVDEVGAMAGVPKFTAESRNQAIDQLSKELIASGFDPKFVKQEMKAMRDALGQAEGDFVSRKYAGDQFAQTDRYKTMVQELETHANKNDGSPESANAKAILERISDRPSGGRVVHVLTQHQGVPAKRDGYKFEFNDFVSGPAVTSKIDFKGASVNYVRHHDGPQKGQVEIDVHDKPDNDFFVAAELRYLMSKSDSTDSLVSNITSNAMFAARPEIARALGTIRQLLDSDVILLGTKSNLPDVASLNQSADSRNILVGAAYAEAALMNRNSKGNGDIAGRNMAEAVKQHLFDDLSSRHDQGVAVKNEKAADKAASNPKSTDMDIRLGVVERFLNKIGGRGSLFAEDFRNSDGKWEIHQSELGNSTPRIRLMGVAKVNSMQSSSTAGEVTRTTLIFPTINERSLNRPPSTRTSPPTCRALSISVVALRRHSSRGHRAGLRGMGRSQRQIIVNRR